MTDSPDTVPDGVPQLETTAPAPPPEHPEIIIITGMSGAGRSHAASVLEDLDWFVVDNLPPRLLDPLVAMMLQSGSGVRRLAAVVDVRTGQFFNDLLKVLQELRENHIDYQLIFLDADDDVLVRRYEAVRRPHPLQGSGRMLDGIAQEREILSQLRQRADVTIDTSDLNVRSGQFFNDLLKVLQELRENHIDYQLIFLDADDDVLVRRYEAVRRPHPLQGSGRMLDGIAQEREILSQLRQRADVTIDTSDLNVHDLARTIKESLGEGADRLLRINVVSFGFKYGLPLDRKSVV